MSSTNYILSRLKIINHKLTSYEKVPLCVLKEIADTTGIIYQEDKLIGPISIDTDIIKTGKRIIKDNNYPELNGKEITNVSKENTMIQNDITKQMLEFLLDSIE